MLVLIQGLNVNANSRTYFVVLTKIEAEMFDCLINFYAFKKIYIQIADNYVTTYLILTCAYFCV